MSHQQIYLTAKCGYFLFTLALFGNAIFTGALGTLFIAKVDHNFDTCFIVDKGYI